MQYRGTKEFCYSVGRRVCTDTGSEQAKARVAQTSRTLPSEEYRVAYAFGSGELRRDMSSRIDGDYRYPVVFGTWNTSGMRPKPHRIW